jgi:hypothetical protein
VALDDSVLLLEIFQDGGCMNTEVLDVRHMDMESIFVDATNVELVLPTEPAQSIKIADVLGAQGPLPCDEQELSQLRGHSIALAFGMLADEALPLHQQAVLVVDGANQLALLIRRVKGCGGGLLGTTFSADSPRAFAAALECVINHFRRQKGRQH